MFRESVSENTGTGLFSLEVSTGARIPRRSAEIVRFEIP